MLYARLLVLAIGLSSAGYGQQIHPDFTTSNRSDPYPNPSWIIKFAPLSLFDPDNTIQLAIERLLNQGHAVQVEFGYGNEQIGLWETTAHGRYSNKETWRVRAEWRLYLRPADKPQGFYAAAEGLYKQVNVLEMNSNGLPCTGPCVPGTLSKEPALKQVWGGHLKIGYQKPLFFNDRFLLDLYGGLGARHRQVRRPDLPVGATINESGGLFGQWPAFPFTPQTEFSLSMGVKLGYAL